MLPHRGGCRRGRQRVIRRQLEPSHLVYPLSVAADGAGYVYIADSRGSRIRVVRPGTQLSVPLGASGDLVRLVVAEGGVIALAEIPWSTAAKSRQATEIPTL